MRFYVLMMLQVTAFGARADGLCDHLLAERWIRLARTPLATPYAVRAAQTPAGARLATIARLNAAATRLNWRFPRFAAELLAEPNSDPARDAIVGEAKSFTLTGAAEITKFLDSVVPKDRDSRWRRGAWLTGPGRGGRFVVTTAALVALGYAWMPFTGMDHGHIWQGTGLMALGFAGFEAMDHAIGRGERASLREIDRLLKSPEPGHAPVLFGREVGQTSVYLLFTPSEQTLDVVWAYYSVIDG